MSNPNKKPDVFDEVLFKPLKGLLSFIVTVLFSDNKTQDNPDENFFDNDDELCFDSGYRNGHQGFRYYQDNSRVDLDDD